MNVRHHFAKLLQTSFTVFSPKWCNLDENTCGREWGMAINPPSLAAFECLLPKCWKKKSAVDLQPRLHETQEKMNESDPSQELMKKKKHRNLENNNDKLSHAWPRDPQQKWIQTLDAKPSPLLPRTTALPRCHVHITWLGQQVNKLGKKWHPYHL
jgi:hypothetical protein